MKSSFFNLSRDYIIFAFVVLLCIAISSFISLRSIYSAQQNELNNNLAFSYDIAENVINEYLEKTEYKMHILKQKLQHSDLTHESINKIFSNSFKIDLISFPNKAIISSDLNWIDVSGKVRVNSRLGILEGDKSFVEGQAMALAQKFPNKYHLYSVKNSDYLGIITALYDGKRNYLGSLNSSFLIDDVNLEIAGYLRKFNTKVIITSDNVKLADLVSQKGLSDAQNYRKLAKYPLAIIAEYDSADQSQKIYDLFLDKLILFLSIGILLLIVLYIFYRRVINPIIRLSDIAEKLGSNKDGVRDVKIPGKNPSKEVYHLAKALQSIKRYQLKLHRTNKSLAETKANLEAYIHIAEETESTKQELMKQFRYVTKESIKGVKDGVVLIKNHLAGKDGLGMTRKSQIEVLGILEEELSYLSEFSSGTLLREKVSSGTVIDDCLKLQNKEIAKKEIVFESKIEDNLPKIDADKAKFIQIITSLLSRVVHAVDIKSKIIFTVKTDIDESAQNLVIKIKASSDINMFHVIGDDHIIISLDNIRTLLVLHNGSLDVKKSKAGTTISAIMPISVKQPSKIEQKNNIVKLFGKD